MQKQRQLNNRTTGMFGGPRMAFGQYLDAGVAQTSGVTYGGQGLGWYWGGYPNVTGGLTELDPQATNVGSNLSAAQQLVDNGNYYGSTTAIDAGLDGAPTGSSNGGTSY